MDERQFEREWPMPYSSEAKEAEQVGTLDVQILLSWFYETGDTYGVMFDHRMPEAA